MSRYWRITFVDNYLSWEDFGSFQQLSYHLPSGIRDWNQTTAEHSIGTLWNYEIEFHTPVRMTTRTVNRAFEQISSGMSRDISGLVVYPFMGPEVCYQTNFCAPCA